MSQSWALAGIFFAAMVVVSCGGSTTSDTPTPTAIPAPTGLLTRTPVVVPHTIPPPPGFVTSSPQPTLVPLTDDQRRQVEAIIRADPTIADVVGDISYSVTGFSPWYTGVDTSTGQRTLIGGGAIVILSQTISHIERDWPFAGYREYYSAWPDDIRAKYLPYTEGTEHQAVGNLRRMEVRVDLNRGKLVAIDILGDPTSGQTVTYPTTGPTPQVSLGVSSDVQDIFSGDARLNAILSGRSYQGPLAVTYSFASPHLHYAAETFSFDQPQDIEADWPIAVNGDAFTGQYQTDTIHFVATGVRSISATVDLDSGQLVSIQPSQHSPGD